jgi:hypothetical protein
MIARNLLKAGREVLLKKAFGFMIHPSGNCSYSALKG